MKIPKPSVGIWDIIYLYNVVYDGVPIRERPFLVVDKNTDCFSSVSLLEISGQPKTGGKFPYNEPVTRSSQNGLNQDSHVKCDMLYINCEHIITGVNVIKFGELEQDKYSAKINLSIRKARDNQTLVYIDQSNNGIVLRGWE